MFSLCIVGQVGEEEEVLMEVGGAREQPWMRHVTHQMTKLFSDTKMTMQFLSHAH